MTTVTPRTTPRAKKKKDLYVFLSFLTTSKFTIFIHYSSFPLPTSHYSWLSSYKKKIPARYTNQRTHWEEGRERRKVGVNNALARHRESPERIGSVSINHERTEKKEGGEERWKGSISGAKGWGVCWIWLPIFYCITEMKSWHLVFELHQAVC